MALRSCLSQFCISSDWNKVGGGTGSGEVFAIQKWEVLTVQGQNISGKRPTTNSRKNTYREMHYRPYVLISMENQKQIKIQNSQIGPDGSHNGTNYRNGHN